MWPKRNSSPVLVLLAGDTVAVTIAAGVCVVDTGIDRKVRNRVIAARRVVDGSGSSHTVRIVDVQCGAVRVGLGRGRRRPLRDRGLRFRRRGSRLRNSRLRYGWVGRDVHERNRRDLGPRCLSTSRVGSGNLGAGRGDDARSVSKGAARRRGTRRWVNRIRARGLGDGAAATSQGNRQEKRPDCGRASPRRQDAAHASRHGACPPTELGASVEHECHAVKVRSETALANPWQADICQRLALVERREGRQCRSRPPPPILKGHVKAAA